MEDRPSRKNGAAWDAGAGGNDGEPGEDGPGWEAGASWDGPAPVEDRPSRENGAARDAGACGEDRPGWEDCPGRRFSATLWHPIYWLCDASRQHNRTQERGPATQGQHRAKRDRTGEPYWATKQKS